MGKRKNARVSEDIAGDDEHQQQNHEDLAAESSEQSLYGVYI